MQYHYLLVPDRKDLFPTSFVSTSSLNISQVHPSQPQPNFLTTATTPNWVDDTLNTHKGGAILKGRNHTHSHSAWRTQEYSHFLWPNMSHLIDHWKLIKEIIGKLSLCKNIWNKHYGYKWMSEIIILVLMPILRRNSVLCFPTIHSMAVKVFVVNYARSLWENRITTWNGRIQECTIMRTISLDLQHKTSGWKNADN